MVQFRYVSILASGNPKKAVFKAKREGDNGDLVVKFTYRYNAEAHQVLASEGHSPQLFYVGDTYSSALQYPNGLVNAPKMVVMEYLSGSTAAQLYDRTLAPSFVYDNVQAAIHILHQNGWVFGNLRRNNIMISRSGKRARLVDFDWCGRDGHDRYPAAINTTSIDWHEDVNRGTLMRKEHDQFMLKKLRLIKNLPIRSKSKPLLSVE